MQLTRKRPPVLPVIIVEVLGDHSTPTPKNIDAPVRLLLHSKGLTEGEWVLKVRRAKISGTAFGRGKVRVYELVLNRIIDMVVQPGLVGSRRRAQLVVPPEYKAREVHDLIKPQASEMVMLTSRTGTTIDNRGNIVSQVDFRRPINARKDRENVRLARLALRFWDNPGHLTALGEAIVEHIGGFGSFQGLYYPEMKEAISKLWASPSDFELALPLLIGPLCDINRHDLFVPYEGRNPKVLTLTERGWIWIEDSRQSKRLNEQRWRTLRLAELERDLAGLMTKREVIEQRFVATIEHIDEQISSLREGLSALEQQREI